jgi:hypothetical protein
MTLLVVPAHHALWFRVRREEPVVAKTHAELEGDLAPIRIAAE